MYPHPYASHLLHFQSPNMNAPQSSLSSSSSSKMAAIGKRCVSDESTDDDMDITRQSLPMSDSQIDGSCHLMSRKKRRGMIEKRRRDRINNSLHELKRLVPAAFEKQGSAKLEKAEILQLTVDHLRTLHSKGFDAFSFDPQKFATDYHIIGFRECAAEIARYLVVHEGLDLQDPLRLRLISHLQCYATQREISLKSNTGWNPSLFTTPMYPSNSSQTSTISTPSNSNNQANTGHSTPINNCESMNLHSIGTSSHHSSYSTNSYAPYSQQPLTDNPMISSSTGTSSAMSCNSPLNSSKSSSSFPMSGYSSVTSSSHTPASTISPSTSAASYSYSYPAGTYFPPAPTYMTPMMPASSNNVSSNGQNSVKHYRPWGTELTTY